MKGGFGSSVLSHAIFIEEPAREASKSASYGAALLADYF